jgi:hypothetical protein
MTIEIKLRSIVVPDQADIIEKATYVEELYAVKSQN